MAVLLRSTSAEGELIGRTGRARADSCRHRDIGDGSVPPYLGETAVIDVAESTVKLLALVVPKLTAVAPVKPVPVMITVLPPAGEPRLGSSLVTVGP